MSFQFLQNINGNNNGLFKSWLDSFSESSQPVLSWHPSSNNNFRNLFLLQNSYLDNYLNKEDNWVTPDLFIYTDSDTEMFDTLFPESKITRFTSPKSNFESLLLEYADISGWYLFEDDSMSVRVKKVENLTEQHTVQNSDTEISTYETLNQSNRIYFFVLEVSGKDIESFDVHVIYANCENQFFLDFLINKHARISCLVHIQDETSVDKSIDSAIISNNLFQKLETKFFITNLNSHFNTIIKEPIHCIKGESWSLNADDIFIFKIK